MNIDYMIFAFLLIILILSGAVTTRSISKISLYLKLGHFAAGFIIMAIATSVPELIISITSAIEKIPELSLGTVLGSNVVNLSLVIGTAVLIAGEINFKDNKIKKELTYPFFIALLPIILASDGILSHIDGIILIIIFIAYFTLVFKQTDFEEEDVVSKKQFIKNLIFFSIGLMSLLISAKYLVDYTSLIASDIGIPVFLIGIILISFGTSLPELTFETISLLHGHKILAVGDLMGSTVSNSTLILGTVSIINPILVPDYSEFQIVSIFFIILISIFSLYLRSKSGLTRLRALLMIIIYIIFLFLTGFNIN
ncbi:MULTISPECIES: sodium:calcium antiporter [Methanobacterium]|uniref:Sodium:calcium antiporter n=1 Tax=Methanobacterium veterum TaxID=408577 RepID=A0A9E5A5W8_9EURY|nr:MULTISPECIES: sodium:calcium antiporter [Methanobacterium]MCZ3367181.1 sodium:calcium antiporter [Methanobacterium veterum]MCZ3373671.1 sodium:calcium antiporter [Methanobacterium veterum]